MERVWVDLFCIACAHPLCTLLGTLLNWRLLVLLFGTCGGCRVGASPGVDEPTGNQNFAVRELCGEGIAFWIHATAFQAVHPHNPAFHAKCSAAHCEKHDRPVCLSRWPSVRVKSIMYNHARCISLRFVVVGAECEVSTRDDIRSNILKNVQFVRLWWFAMHARAHAFALDAGCAYLPLRLYVYRHAEMYLMRCCATSVAKWSRCSLFVFETAQRTCCRRGVLIVTCAPVPWSTSGTVSLTCLCVCVCVRCHCTFICVHRHHAASSPSATTRLVCMRRGRTR